MKKHTVGVSAPIFVVGPPRSGTTLTARILGRHSRIFMPGETHFFDDIYARRRELGEFSDAGSIQKALARLRTLYRRYDENVDQKRIDRLCQSTHLIEALTNCRSYEELFSRFMGIQMRSVGKMRWGNNVPKDIFYVEEILSFYPGAKFLVCVRDPRDFLLSYKNKWKTTGEENAGRIRRLYHPVMTSLLWKANVKQILRMQNLIPNGNFMLIRYEKLVENPQEVIRKMSRFIGEHFEATMLDVEQGNSSFEVNETGIYTSSVGRWNSLLTNEEIYVVQRVTGSCLVDLGYVPQKFKINPLKLGYIYTTLPYGLWRGLWANRAIRGPLLPYVATRLAALWHVPAR